MSDLLHLDHAASTPPRTEVLEAFLELSRRVVGNPAAAHAAGRAARTVLEEARERVAGSIGRSPHEVVFTSGGTEADVLAVVGLARAAAEAGRRHVVCSAVEHPAVIDAVDHLVAVEGLQVTWVAPGAPRPLTADEVTGALRDDSGLVVVTAADGELGIVQPADVADEALDRGIAVHRDAVQALATVGVPARGSLALSGHKIGAPVGIGAAVLPRGWPVRPLVPGPGQERGVRSGTQPAALAGAFALAVEMAVEEASVHAARAGALSAVLADGLATIDGVRVTPPPTGSVGRLPTHVHATVAGVDGEALVTALDAAGVAVSGGTACATGTTIPSRVVGACGLEGDATLRCSVGRDTTEETVREAVRRTSEVVIALRAGGGGFL